MTTIQEVYVKHLTTIDAIQNNFIEDIKKITKNIADLSTDIIRDHKDVNQHLANIQNKSIGITNNTNLVKEFLSRTTMGRTLEATGRSLLGVLGISISVVVSIAITIVAFPIIFLIVYGGNDPSCMYSWLPWESSSEQLKEAAACMEMNFCNIDSLKDENAELEYQIKELQSKFNDINIKNGINENKLKLKLSMDEFNSKLDLVSKIQKEIDDNFRKLESSKLHCPKISIKTTSLTEKIHDLGLKIDETNQIINKIIGFNQKPEPKTKLEPAVDILDRYSGRREENLQNR